MDPFRVSPVTGLSSVTRLATVILLGVVVAGGCSRNSKDPAQDRRGEQPGPNPKRVKAPRLAPGLAPAGTAALIDLDRSPLGALLEGRLLDGAKLAWLERGDIDKLLAEQELQALFAPEAGSQRIALGKMLKAHVLALLRSADNRPGAKQLELVVFETQQGLRLWRQELEPSKDADADAAALEKVVQEAIAKQAAKITEVCAVPPFVSNDLGHQFDHLKSAYAKILEQQLQRRPGVLLVEIAEAQAIGREVALADPAATLERRLPVYFLGDYRNEGIGDKQRVAVRLRVRRGEQELAVVEKTALSPAEAPQELQRMAASLAEKVFGSAQAVLDPEAEAKQLALRADEFDRLGSWPEALAVAEASLLLTPEQPEMRHRAAIACFLLARQHLQRARGNAAEAVQAMTTYRRGLEHQEVYLRPVASRKGAEPVARHSDYRLRTEFSFAAGRFLSYRPDTQKLWELCQETLKEELESVLRLMRARAHAGCDEYHLLDRVVEFRPSRERYPILENLILELKDLPGAGPRTAALALHGHPPPGPFEKSYLAFLEKLAKVEDADQVKASAESLLKGLNEAIRQARTQAAEKKAAMLKPKPMADDPGEIVFRPLQFTWEAPDGKTGLFTRLFGCLPAGDKIDVMWSGGLFVMKQKGKLRQVWVPAPGDRNNRILHVSYDGRYVWACVQRIWNTPLLLILDPVSERVWQITAEDGLPIVPTEKLPFKNTEQYMMAAPLGPGKVCLIGTFGRAWVAIATFDPAAGKSVKVFHEARDVSAVTDAQAWKRTTVVFSPFYAFTVTGVDGGGKPRQRVLVGRRNTDGLGESNPLLVDPETLTVEVVQDPMSRDEVRPGLVHGGALYYVHYPPPARVPVPAKEQKHALFRFGFPRLKPEVVVPDVEPWGRSAFLGDQLHIAGSNWWWTGTLADGTVRPAARPPHPIEAVFPSAHYGLLVSARDRLRYLIFQVDYPNH